ncbi:Oviduct-specific glycoprotein [Tyrophagus putrescentiae]|nr:Oviduct-specific glycoprotein [Tyrophagus putrescentiae]
MKFFAVFAVVFLFGVLAPTVSASSTFTCPTQSGFYRNPEDPHKFYECVNGHAYEYTCPAGLVFNESVQQCDYTTGPEVHHSTAGPVTVPTGGRSRHTEGTTGPTEKFTGTTPTVVTRGHHGGDHDHHSDSPTTVAAHNTEPASTRGHHDHFTEPTTQSGHGHQHEEVTTTQEGGHHHQEGEATTRGRHGW